MAVVVRMGRIHNRFFLNVLQAHALLKKGRLYQQINGALKRSAAFRPNVSQLPRTLELQDGDEQETVTTLHRDAAVSNIRFLNIFYGYSAKTFALAVNLLDRVICKVKVSVYLCSWYKSD